MSPRECDCPGPPCTCAPRPADTFGPTGGFTGGPGPVTNTTNYPPLTVDGYCRECGAPISRTRGRGWCHWDTTTYPDHPAIPGDPTAPYEAVLTAWEQSGDVTRMWLAKEFRESLGGAA